VFGGAVGCTPPGPNLKSPVVEQYTLPPADDARFSSPPAYPKETLNQDLPKSSAGAASPKLPSQMPQMRGGMGGSGRPGGGF